VSKSSLFTPPRLSLAQVRRDSKAKAYRKLVNALRSLLWHADSYYQMGGEDVGGRSRARKLLRELGEIK